MIKNKLPEILSPAGSPEALYAAAAAGADAVYFGAKSFSARAYADNFDEKEITDAISYCRLVGIKTYITVNTQLFGREADEAAALVGRLWLAGADAFIIADVGLARILKRTVPGIELHASTQMSGQNLLSAQELYSLGFQRMVAPREISRDNLKKLCKASPVEIEMFVHGALCVSHSGQCLMSSVIGGRSGNRGECAQPCRLPYDCKSCRYPLSLKDLCLAGHMKEIISSGVSSLKLEGRMKSPEYVYGVTKIYRRLLDERRDASSDEIKALGGLFSRSGFTDGYFSGDIGSRMLGVRTTDDKGETKRSAELCKWEKPRVKLELSANIVSGEYASLVGTAMVGGEKLVRSVKSEEIVSGSSRMSDERVYSSLSKLGDTPFYTLPELVTVNSDENSSMPVSALNAMRRGLCEKLLLSAIPSGRRVMRADSEIYKKTPSRKKTAYFRDISAIPDEAYEYFDFLYVPLEDYGKLECRDKTGIAFPPVALDSELGGIEALLEKAVLLGCKSALITGMWQLPLAEKHGLDTQGSIRLNICNSASASSYKELGLDRAVLSCEPGLSRMASVCGIECGAVAYGRLPVMTLEKCVIRELAGINSSKNACSYCDKTRFTVLTDRVGARFPVTREYGHRNVIYNSVPVWMADKSGDINAEGLFLHFIFTDESGKEISSVIEKYKKGLPYGKPFKRI